MPRRKSPPQTSLTANRSVHQPRPPLWDDAAAARDGAPAGSTTAAAAAVEDALDIKKEEENPVRRASASEVDSGDEDGEEQQSGGMSSPLEEEEDEEEDQQLQEEEEEEDKRDEEEEEGLVCSLVLAGRRRRSGWLTAAPSGLCFVSRTDPDLPAFEVAYERIKWAGWQAAEQGSRGENGGYLHVELYPRRNPLGSRKHSHKGDQNNNNRRGGKGKSRGKTTGGRRLRGENNVDEEVSSDGDHSFVHFAAGGPRRMRNMRLRAVVADITRYSSQEQHAIAASKTNERQPARYRSKKQEEDEEDGDEKVDGIRVERIGRVGDSMPGVVGRTGMCRVHLTPTAIVQLDHRPFIVLPYAEIEVACLERALFKPALRNFDLALVKKAVREQAISASVTATASPSKKTSKTAAKRKPKRQKVGKKRRQQTSDEESETEEVAIGGKNLTQYLAQIFSIPMEHLGRVEKRLESEGVLHFRGLANVQWPPLLNFVRENPDEFEKTGGWAEYLKPRQGSAKLTDTEDDDEDDGGSEGEDEMWGDEEGESDGGEFMPDASLLNASYSEIDEADDADALSMKRRRHKKQKEKGMLESKKRGGREERIEESKPKRQKRSRKTPKTTGGLAALLDAVADVASEDELPHSAKRKTAPKRKRKVKEGVKEEAGRAINTRKKRTTRASRSKREAAIPDASVFEIVDSEEEVQPTRKRRKSETVESEPKKRKRAATRSSSSADAGDSSALTKSDARLDKGAKASPRKRSKTTQLDGDKDTPKRTRAKRGEAAKAALTRSQQVLQRQFSGYNTRSRAPASTSENQDKIIHIDAPPARRRRKTAASANASSTADQAQPKLPKRMKAEAEVIEPGVRPVSLRIGLRTAMQRDIRDVEDRSCSGDESASLDASKGEDESDDMPMEEDENMSSDFVLVQPRAVPLQQSA